MVAAIVRACLRLLNSNRPSLIAKTMGGLADRAIPVLRSPVGVEQALDSISASYCPLEREDLQ